MEILTRKPKWIGYIFPWAPKGASKIAASSNWILFIISYQIDCRKSECREECDDQNIQDPSTLQICDGYEKFSHLHVLKAAHWNSAKALLPKGSLPFHLQWWCSHTADLRLELPWHYTQMCNEDLNMLCSFSQSIIHLLSNPIIPF